MVPRKQFEESLKELKLAIIQMGDEVESAIASAVQSLNNGDVKLAKDIVDKDIEINALEEKIDTIGTRLIATQQPVAKDLRRILIAFKISSDLERMGDLAVDIAKSTIRLEGGAPIKPLVNILRMAELACQMTGESIQAYTDENMDLAYKTASVDDEVDDLHSRNMHEVFAMIAGEPSSINKAMPLAFVSRYLERIADHATNIGESVVYLVKGKRPDLNQ